MKSFREWLNEKELNEDKIGNLITVNAGKIVKNGNDEFEAMSKSHSGHGQNIISYYFKDGVKKLELSGWLIEEDNYETMVFGLAYYNDYKSLESYKYTQKIPGKYDKFKDLVREAHKTIFKGKIK